MPKVKSRLSVALNQHVYKTEASVACCATPIRLKPKSLLSISKASMACSAKPLHLKSQEPAIYLLRGRQYHRLPCSRSKTRVAQARRASESTLPLALSLPMHLPLKCAIRSRPLFSAALRPAAYGNGRVDQNDALGGNVILLQTAVDLSLWYVSGYRPCYSTRMLECNSLPCWTKHK